MPNSIKMLIVVVFTLATSMLINIDSRNRMKKNYNEIVIMAFENGYLKGALNFKYHRYNKFHKRLMESTKGFCKLLNIDTTLVQKLENK